MGTTEPERARKREKAFQLNICVAQLCIAKKKFFTSPCFRCVIAKKCVCTAYIEMNTPGDKWAYCVVFCVRFSLCCLDIISTRASLLYSFRFIWSLLSGISQFHFSKWNIYVSTMTDMFSLFRAPPSSTLSASSLRRAGCVFHSHIPDIRRIFFPATEVKHNKVHFSISVQNENCIETDDKIRRNRCQKE